MTTQPDPLAAESRHLSAKYLSNARGSIPGGKRMLDICLALALGVLILPVLLLLLGWLWLREGRPLFYGGERMAAPDRRFCQWKLRTMRAVDQDEGVTGGHKADRITPTGLWLRRTRLDEVPQLWNILKGDMSFVGPRPPLPSYFDRFPAVYRQVLRARPGLTGLATIRCMGVEERLMAGCRTAEETDRLYVQHSLHRKARLDLIYQRHWSLGLDLWLLGRTCRIVFRAIVGKSLQ